MNVVLSVLSQQKSVFYSFDLESSFFIVSVLTLPVSTLMFGSDTL